MEVWTNTLANKVVFKESMVVFLGNMVVVLGNIMVFWFNAKLAHLEISNRNTVTVIVIVFVTSQKHLKKALHTY